MINYSFVIFPNLAQPRGRMLCVYNIRIIFFKSMRMLQYIYTISDISAVPLRRREGDN